MMVFKRKQIVVLSLIVMIVVAGYLQYTYKQTSVAVNEDKERGKLGEAVYVTGENISEEGKDKDENESKTDVNASREANDFFAQAKLDKEITRSKNTDVLKSISEDPNASKETRESAYSQMMQIISKAEKEMKIESLLKEKGFKDAVVFFGEDDSIDVVVKAPNLSSAQVVQIADVVCRQGSIEITKVHVKNKF